MKAKLTLDINVTMSGVSHDGTGCQGYLPEGTKYSDIVKVFGEPQFGESPDGKMKAEWIGKIGDIVFTIYDYKSKIEPQNNTDWHIGGKVKLASELVKAYFKKCLCR